MIFESCLCFTYSKNNSVIHTLVNILKTKKLYFKKK